MRTIATLSLLLLGGIACGGGSRPAPQPAPRPMYPPAYQPQPAYRPQPPPANAGPASMPCSPEGSYECTPDRRAMTVCRGGRTAIASTCRGTRGCVSAAAVDCDHSVAAIGDPCDGPRDIACSTDGRQQLRCNAGVYQVGEACRNACLATSGRVLCQ